MDLSILRRKNTNTRVMMRDEVILAGLKRRGEQTISVKRNGAACKRKLIS
jgi:hypothetical protein